MRIVAVHGVPVGPLTWSRLRTPMETPALGDGDLAAWTRAIGARCDAGTLLVGHDLGGLIAASVAASQPVAGVVLTGTALGPYWDAVRWTSWPLVRRYFYDRHAGRKFVARGVGGAARPRWTAEVEATLPPDLAERMCRIAAGIRPPTGLARRLRGTRVWVVNGRDDPWYPPIVARAVARGTGGTLVTVPGGHWCMWEEPAAFDAVLREIAIAPASG